MTRSKTEVEQEASRKAVEIEAAEEGVELRLLSEKELAVYTSEQLRNLTSNLCRRGFVGRYDEGLLANGRIRS